MRKLFIYILSDSTIAQFLKKHQIISKISIYIDVLFLPMFPLLVNTVCSIPAYLCIWFIFTLICFYLLIASS